MQATVNHNVPTTNRPLNAAKMARAENSIGVLHMALYLTRDSLGEQAGNLDAYEPGRYADI